MDNIRNTSGLVKEVLISDKKARNSDNYLYYLICKAKLAGSGLDISKVSLEDGLLRRKSLNLPNFETVRRSRQKVQQTLPELAGDSKVNEVRMIREEEFRNYAREVEV